MFSQWFLKDSPLTLTCYANFGRWVIQRYSQVDVCSRWADGGNLWFAQGFEGFRLTVRFPGSRKVVGKPSGVHPASAARNITISNDFARFWSFAEHFFILLTPPYIARLASLRENLWFAQGFWGFSVNRKIVFYFAHRAQPRKHRNITIPNDSAWFLKLRRASFYFAHTTLHTPSNTSPFHVIYVYTFF